MSWSLVDSDSVGFADGGTGHLYTLPAGAPDAGDLDVLTVNSDTTVTMPDGFSVATSFVGSQGSYLWYRIAAGDESDTVTLTTNGNFATAVTWSRWTGADSFDTAALAHADASSDVTTPAVSVGPLAGSSELVIVFAALHSFSTAPTAPVWSTGYTALESVTQSPAAALVGYSSTAGPDAQTPSVSWTSAVVDRYVLVAAFAPTAEPDTGMPGNLAAATVASKLTLATAGVRLTTTTSGGDA